MLSNADEMLKLTSDMEDVGEQYAAWKAEANHLERMRKRILSLIETEHVGCPVNEREMRARADQRYLNHIEGQKVAETKANKFYVQWETVKAKIEVRRSINATARSQMNLT